MKIGYHPHCADARTRRWYATLRVIRVVILARASGFLEEGAITISNGDWVSGGASLRVAIDQSR
jgi:hypothetical protein